MTEWFDNSELWYDISPLIFHESNWENAKAGVEQGISLLQLAPGAAVLDIPCGPGRHALEFSFRGYRVTAVDLMPFLLDQGRRRALANNLDIEFIQKDMRDFVRSESFDLMWNFFSSFGYFSDPTDDQSFLRNAFQSLRQGGRLLLEMSSRDHALDFWKKHNRFQHPPVNGVTLIEKGRLSDDQNQISLHWRIVNGDRTREHHFSLRLYSESQMKSMLQTIGFADIAIYGDMNGAPYTSTSERMVVVAGK